MTSPGYMTPRDPNEPSLENIHPPKCTCGAAERRSGTSRHMNKEIPRLPKDDTVHRQFEIEPVDRLMEEAKQLHLWAGELADDIEDLQDGDTVEPERLSTINDILAVLKLLAQKV